MATRDFDEIDELLLAGHAVGAGDGQPDAPGPAVAPAQGDIALGHDQALPEPPVPTEPADDRLLQTDPAARAADSMVMATAALAADERPSAVGAAPTKRRSRTGVALLGVAAAAAIVAAWSWQQTRSTAEPADASFGAPIPAGPAVALVAAPLPSQAASAAVLDDASAQATEPEAPASAASDAVPGAELEPQQDTRPPIPDLPTAAPATKPPATPAAKLPAVPTTPVAQRSTPSTAPVQRPAPATATAAPPVRSAASAAADGATSSLVALSDAARKARVQTSSPAASAAASTGQPVAAAVAVAGPQAASTSGNPSERTLPYGTDGILALTSAGVIIFDQAKGSQRELSVGSALPGGSVIKAVHPTRHQIETDRGMIVMR